MFKFAFAWLDYLLLVYCDFHFLFLLFPKISMLVATYDVVVEFSIIQYMYMYTKLISGFKCGWLGYHSMHVILFFFSWSTAVQPVCRTTGK